MGKYFIRFHPSTLTQRFHVAPDVGTVQRFSIPGSENGTFGFMSFFKIFAQYSPQLPRQEDRAAFALVVDLRVDNTNGINCYKPQLRNPNASGAYRLHYQGKLAIAYILSGMNEAFVFCLRQFASLVPKNCSLSCKVAA